MRATALAASILAVAGCAALAPGAARAQWGVGYDEATGWHLAASVERMRPALQGDLLLGRDTGGTPLDVDDTLDLRDDDVLAGRAELKLGSQHLRFEYLPLRYRGDAVLDTTAVALGVPFSAGDEVTSELGMRGYQLSYRYDFSLGEYLTLAPILEANLFDAWMKFEDLTVPGTRVEESVRQPVPMLGMRVEVRPLPRLELFAEARGLRARAIGDLAEVRVYGGEAGVSLLVTRNLVARARYRMDDYSLSFADVDVDMRLGGPSLDLELRF